MKPPRILNDAAISATRLDRSLDHNWWFVSMRMTYDALVARAKAVLEEERNQALERIDKLQMTLAQRESELRWFEETYSTRAFAPVRQRRRLAERCLHCGAREARKIGKYWVCFECQKQWELTVGGELASAPTNNGEQADG